MQANKLRQSYSCYHSPLPTDSPLHEPPATRYRAIPKKPPIFSIEAHQKNKNTDLYNYLQREQAGIFSLEKLNMNKIKEQREFLEKAKLPSFNIKKILDQHTSQRKIRQEKKRFTGRESNLLSCDVVSRELGRTKYDLRQFWNKYLQSEQLNSPLGNEMQHINKSMGLVVNRNKDNKSQVMSKTHYQKSKQIDFNPERSERHRMIDKDRTTFFVNNFIKTRYRKRSNPTSTAASPKFEKNVGYQLGSKKREDTFQKNCIVPWEKVHDTEQDNFMA